MNSLVLNSHQYNPKITSPLDHSLLRLFNDSEDYFLDFISILLDLFKAWPIIVGLVKIIPIHLVHSYSKYSFIRLIDPFWNDSFIQELIDIETGSMSIVEY